MHKTMPIATDLLSILEEEKSSNIKQLAKKSGIQVTQLEKILKDLSKHNIVEYNQQTGKIKMSP
jgi:predicted transcriptional regulator